MKKIFALSLIALSTLVMAGEITRYPTVQINGVFVSYDKLCVAGDMLIADSNYKPCVQWSNPVGEQDAVCLAYGNVAMETPVKYVETYCSNWMERGDNVYCAAYSTREAVYPLTVKAEVYKMRNGEGNEVFVRSFDYTVPACK